MNRIDTSPHRWWCIVVFGVTAPVMAQCEPSEPFQLLAHDGNWDDLLGWPVAVSVDTVVAGARGCELYYDGGFLQDAGAAYVFTAANGIWSESAKLTASDAAEFDTFGWSVAMDKDTLAIGATGWSHYHDGAVYIFRRSGGIWQEEAKLTVSDDPYLYEFGYSLDVDGDTVLVGAPYNFKSRGAVYVFVRNAGMWTRQQVLTASDPSDFARFGTSVGLDGGYAIVGADYALIDGVRAGKAYIFERVNGVWAESARLMAPEGGEQYFFGYSVAISGDTVMVGAPDEKVDGTPEAGAVYAFNRSGGEWLLGERLVPSNPEDGESSKFGISVAMSDESAVVGAPGESTPWYSYGGAAYVLRREQGVWKETAKVFGDDWPPGVFGYRVALSNSTAAVGDWRYRLPGGQSFAGAAYVFDLACSGCSPDLDGSGALDLFDFLTFVNLFNAADPRADCDHNGAFDLFDFLCFVNAFNAGC